MRPWRWREEGEKEREERSYQTSTLGTTADLMKGNDLVCLREPLCVVRHQHARFSAKEGVFKLEKSGRTEIFQQKTSDKASMTYFRRGSGGVWKWGGGGIVIKKGESYAGSSSANDAVEQRPPDHGVDSGQRVVQQVDVGVGIVHGTRQRHARSLPARQIHAWRTQLLPFLPPPHHHKTSRSAERKKNPHANGETNDEQPTTR